MRFLRTDLSLPDRLSWEGCCGTASDAKIKLRRIWLLRTFRSANSSITRVGTELKNRGIRPWLDEWEIRPGEWWQRVLEEQLNTIKSAAVFVGPSGIAPWHRAEMDVLVRRFVEKGSPAIPVILAGNTDFNPDDLPVFLRGAHWVDFRRNDPDPMDNLEWGITGVRRVKSLRARRPRDLFF